jgi:hypothetical protein
VKRSRELMRIKGREVTQTPGSAPLSKACHPERSTTASKASRRAQSKDPYPAATLFGRIKAFSPCSPQSATKSLKLPNKVVDKPSGNGSFDSASAFALAQLRMTT